MCQSKGSPWQRTVLQSDLCEVSSVLAGLQQLCLSQGPTELTQGTRACQEQHFGVWAPAGRDSFGIRVAHPVLVTTQPSTALGRQQGSRSPHCSQLLLPKESLYHPCSFRALQEMSPGCVRATCAAHTQQQLWVTPPTGAVVTP